MPERPEPLFDPSDLLHAASLLTRLPVPVDHARAGARAAAAMWAHPLVGAALGALTGAAYAGLAGLGAPPLFAACLALALGVGLTGALHEDGLADCADGFGAPVAPERRREIMKDPRVGTFGAVAVALVLIAKAAALAALPPAQAVAAAAASGAVSRAFLALALRLPAAAGPGLAAAAGRPAAATAWISAALGAALGAALAGQGGLVALAAAALAAGAFALTARRLIGGVTGDALGAGQTVGEALALGALAASAVA